MRKTVTARHDSVSRENNALAVAAGCNVLCEVFATNPAPLGSRSKPDATHFLPNTITDRHPVQYIDVSIVHPLAPCNLVSTADKKGSAINAVQRKKLSQHQALVDNGETVVPFVLNTFGGIGNKASAYISKLHNLLRKRRGPAKAGYIVSRAISKIAFRLHAGNHAIYDETVQLARVRRATGMSRQQFRSHIKDRSRFAPSFSDIYECEDQYDQME